MRHDLLPPGAKSPCLTADAATVRSLYGHSADELKLIGVTGAMWRADAAELIAGILSRAGIRAGLLSAEAGASGPEGQELRCALRRLADGGYSHAVIEIPPDPESIENIRGLRLTQCVFTGDTFDAGAYPALSDAAEVLIIGLDGEGSRELIRAAGSGACTYSARSDAADLTARDIKLYPDGVAFCALMTGKLEKLRVGKPGMDWVYIALAAAASAVNAGIGLETVRNALEGLAPGENINAPEAGKYKGGSL